MRGSFRQPHRACLVLVAPVLLTVLPAGRAGPVGSVTLSDAAAGAAGPVWARLREPPSPGQVYVLTAPGCDPVPAQPDASGRLWWWTPARPGSSTWTVERRAGDAAARVRLDRAGEGLINVTIDGKPFTALNFGRDLPKPFLYPVIGPTGDPVTRDYPMQEDNALEKQGKRQDHHHHRSMWTAHGDVRTHDLDQVGSNYWNDALQKGDDPQRVRGIPRAVAGPVFGQVAFDVEWMNDRGRRELSEERTYTFFAADADSRVIDARICLKFTDGDVLFADTKEGGLIAIRTAVTIDEVGGGRMCNSEGQVGEKECWGRPADWCDYTGKVGDQVVGIAIFDAPANFRHPTPWHIRGYGLFAANPFGLGQYAGNKSLDGGKLFRKGETVEFNYRVVIHQGDDRAANIAGQYRLYAGAPLIIR